MERRMEDWMDIGDGQLAVFRCNNVMGWLDFFWTERGREDEISYGQSCFGFMWANDGYTSPTDRLNSTFWKPSRSLFQLSAAFTISLPTHDYKQEYRGPKEEKSEKRVTKGMRARL